MTPIKEHLDRIIADSVTEQLAEETVNKLLDAERSVAEYETHMPEVQKLRR